MSEPKDANDGFDDESTAGWDAIDASLNHLYGNRQPLHFGTAIPAQLGGNDPLHGISVYKTITSRPHWHFVTYGFSELFEKGSDVPEISGFGFELTFRLACSLDDEAPPNWSLDFLQNLARYVFHTGNAFASGHTMNLNGPICAGSQTAIHAICVILDPQLPPADTPNGRVTFLQIVGITIDELDAIGAWNNSDFIDLISRTDPLLVTDLERVSCLNDPAIRAEIVGRTAVEGSESGRQYVSELSISLKSHAAVIRFQSIIVDGTRKRLAGRILFGRELVLISDDATVLFVPGEAVDRAWEDDLLRVTLTESAARELIDTLRPRAGRYTFQSIPELEIEVLRTEIKDRDGNVLEIVG